MSAYKRSLLDRLGPDSPAIIRSAVVGLTFSPLGAVVGAALGNRLGATGNDLVWFVIAGAIFGAFTLYFLMRSVPKLGGAVMQATLMPTGNTTPYETDFSYEMALAMKGDVTTALQSFEEKITAGPADATVRLKAAEMYLTNGDPERARDLFREVQRIPNVERRDDVTASYRLVDLYRGKLADPAKALPEFRRLIERYPGSQIETQARDALAKLKSEMVFEQ